MPTGYPWGGWSLAWRESDKIGKYKSSTSAACMQSKLTDTVLRFRVTELAIGLTHRAKIGVLEEAYQIVLSSLLQCEKGG